MFCVVPHLMYRLCLLMFVYAVLLSSSSSDDESRPRLPARGVSFIIARAALMH